MCGAQKAMKSFCIAEVQSRHSLLGPHGGGPPASRLLARTGDGQWHGEWHKREGRSVSERPKSREETPKVGSDASAWPGRAAHAGIWLHSCCTATVAPQIVMHLGAFVAEE